MNVMAIEKGHACTQIPIIHEFVFVGSSINLEA